MKLDAVRETAINNLFILLEKSNYTTQEMRIINDCATLLINGRTPEQVDRMEKELFNKINGGE